MVSTVSPSGQRQRSGPRSVDSEEVFEALARDGCRAVMRAVGDETLTAAEIGDRVDAPMSSIYRHLDSLASIGLLTESIRVDPHGRNQRQYSLAVSELAVSLGGDFTVQLR
ncbi:MAG: helix-turn-helix domain-containing protein [Haloarculaceae archaeon]